MSEAWKTTDKAIIANSGSFAGAKVTLVDHNVSPPREWLCMVHGGPVHWFYESDLRRPDPVKLDPREPDPVESRAPRDGQANTSGIKADFEPGGLTGEAEFPQVDISECLGVKSGSLPCTQILRDVADYCLACQIASFGRPARSISTVVRGVALWQQADTKQRRASIQLTGHKVDVWITLQPSGRTHHHTFLTPDTAENVERQLDALIMVGAEFANVEFVNTAWHPPDDIFEDGK